MFYEWMNMNICIAPVSANNFGSGCVLMKDTLLPPAAAMKLNKGQENHHAMITLGTTSLSSWANLNATLSLVYKVFHKSYETFHHKMRVKSAYVKN